jgi:hypothetical protein
MPDIIHEIEIINGDDNRLNEVAIKVVLKNISLTKTTLLTLIPDVSDDVEIEEKFDPFQEESEKKFRELCAEMTLIVNNRILITNSEHREQIIEANKKVITSITSNIPLLFRSYIFNKQWFDSQMKQIETEVSKMKFVVSTAKDANWAFDKWIKPLSDDNLDKQLYSGKLFQLSDLQRGDDVGDYIAFIDPESFYSRIYVLKFKRRLFSTRIYDIGFDYKYITDNSPREYRENISTSLNITPHPFFLTLFAAIFSLLGTLLKFGMENVSISQRDVLKKYEEVLITKGTVSVIIAILFFNIYEFTDIGKKLKIGINWRTALVFGILAGLLGDRLVEALRVLLGLGK